MSRRAKIVTLVIAALGVGYLLYRVRGILTPFYLGAAIAYVSFPLVQRLEGKQVPRSLAILLVYAIFAVLALLLFYAILPSLSRELDEIVATLPEKSRAAEESVNAFLDRLRRMWIPDGMRDIVAVSLQRIELLLERLAERLAEMLIGTVTQLFHIIIAPFLAFYILRDFARIRKMLISWLPSHVRRDVVELAVRVNRVVGGFLRGQLIVSAVVGTLVAVGLSLLGVRYALVLGLFAGLVDIIPYFGPILAAVPAIGFALMESPLTAVWVLLLLMSVQQFESSILSPKIVGERVGLHPLTVIFAVLAGGDLMGVVGMFLAVPIAATVKVVGAYVAAKILDS